MKKTKENDQAKAERIAKNAEKLKALIPEFWKSGDKKTLRRAHGLSARIKKEVHKELNQLTTQKLERRLLVVRGFVKDAFNEQIAGAVEQTIRRHLQSVPKGKALYVKDLLTNPLSAPDWGEKNG